MAAYDSRNPLGIINLYSADLLKELMPVLPEGQAERVSETRRACMNLLACIDDLSDFSTIESGGLQFILFTRFSVLPAAEEKSARPGLAICRRIVEGHGGESSLAISPGCGSTFRFTLPVDPDVPGTT